MGVMAGMPQMCYVPDMQSYYRMMWYNYQMSMQAEAMYYAHNGHPGMPGMTPPDAQNPGQGFMGYPSLATAPQAIVSVPAAVEPEEPLDAVEVLASLSMFGLSRPSP